MIKFLRKSIICLCTICTALIFCCQVWAMSLSFNPSTSNIGIADMIDIDIVASGLENTDLATFDLNINYDNSILSFDSYTFTDSLGDVNAGDTSDWSWGDDGFGTLNLAELSWLWDFSFQDDSFVLATVTFLGNEVGISPLFFSDVILGDNWGSPLYYTLNTGLVEVTAPVPEPATMILLSSGLLGFGIFRRKSIKLRRVYG